MDSKAVRKINRTFYVPWFRFMKYVASCLHLRGRIYGYKTLPDEPAIYLSRHENMYAPVHIVAHTDIPKLRVLVMNFFLDKEACYRQYSTYTFPVNLGWGKRRSRFFAKLLSPLVASLMRSGRAIPVYRSSKDVILTIRESIEALINGESLMIMPEKAYDSLDKDVQELYSGFLQIARYYCTRTGRNLNLIPVYTHPASGDIFFRDALTYDKNLSFRENKEKLLPLLAESLSEHPTHKKDETHEAQI